MDTLPSLAVLPTLNNDFGNSSNVSASDALLDTWGKGSLVTYLPLHVPPLATPTFLVDKRNIGRPNFFLSYWPRWCPSAPESYVNIVALLSLYNVAIVGLRLNCTCLPSHFMILMRLLVSVMIKCYYLWLCRPHRWWLGAHWLCHFLPWRCIHPLLVWWPHWRE